MARPVTVRTRNWAIAQTTRNQLRRSPSRTGSPRLPSSVARIEAIADAPDGDELRAARRVELRAKARNVGLQPQEVRVHLRRPAGTDEVEVGDDVAAGANQQLEEAILDRRQAQERPADAGFVAARVDLQV